jgi:hypothetical protein
LFDFLSPTLLWGLLSLSIPVILHFIRFFQRETIPFSSLAFLDKRQIKKFKNLNLVQLLLLLLRLLILAAVILAFSQPVYVAQDVLSIAGKNLVIGIDQSFSVKQQDKLQRNQTQFLDLLEKVLETADDQTHFRLATGGNTITMNASEVRTLVSDALNDDNITNEDVRNQIQHLAGLPAINNQQTYFIIFSDFQLHDTADSANDPNELDIAPEQPFFFYNFTADSLANDGLVALTGAKLELMPFPTVQLGVRRLKEKPAEINFFNEDQALMTRKTPAQASSVFRLPLNELQRIKGRISLPPDGFNADNSQYWGLDLTQRYRILVAGDSSFLKPLTALFQASRYTASIAARYVSSDLLLAEINGGWDGIVWVPAATTASQFSALNRYRQNGGKIFIFPGSDEKAFGEAVSGLTGRRVELRKLTDGNVLGVDSHAFSGDLARFPFRFFVNTYYHSSGDARIRFSNGRPLLFSEGESLYCLTTPLTAANGNVLYHPGLPLWFMQWFEAEAGNAAFFPNLMAGIDTTLNLLRRISSAETGIWSGPAGRFSLPIADGKLVLPAEYITRTGIYSFALDNITRYYAVNIHPDEFAQSYLNRSELILLDNTSNTSVQQSLWQYFLLLALIFLLFETLLRMYFTRKTQR